MLTSPQKTHGGRVVAFVLLIVPLALYILVYLIPLGSIVSLSVDNRGLSDRFPALRAEFALGADGTADGRAAALLQDLAALDTKAKGETARMLNQKISGFRSLLPETGRKAETLALLLMALVWQAPTAGQWLTALTLSLVGLAGQYMIIRAYDHCEASLLAPLSYTEIVTSTLVSWWFFREVPDA